MLTLFKINNIALIDSLEIEFGAGLNLLTGETGSGKSIIVDSLGAVTGDRISTDLIKEGEQTARIEGLFTLDASARLLSTLNEVGIELEKGAPAELIIRRELSRSGKNRVFINDQLATRALLRSIGQHLADIHGQGEQAALFDVASHAEMLDEAGKLTDMRAHVKEAHRHLERINTELGMLQQNEAEKLQLLDILRFQITEIEKAGLRDGEDTELETEKRRLSNVEKLSILSEESYTLLYEAEGSTLATLERAAKKIEELAEFDSRFTGYIDSLRSAQAVIDDLAITLRDFSSHLEYSPGRLDEIENRLAEISRLKRKYGDTIEAVIGYLARSKDRLDGIETSELRETELQINLKKVREEYLLAANAIHDARVKAALRFEREVEKELKSVALEKAKFQVKIVAPSAAELTTSSVDASFTSSGYDHVEFYFSANPGESPRPIVRIASGGEASRLMLVLK
ncbi:MAG TPA: DNA repair protein RecN, partial [Blastocatellia bacterium]